MTTVDRWVMFLSNKEPNAAFTRTTLLHHVDFYLTGWSFLLFMSMYVCLQPLMLRLLFFSSGVALGYQLGQVVRSCNFDNSLAVQHTGCRGFTVPRGLEPLMNSADTSAYDGPSGDHTPGRRGTCMNCNEVKNVDWGAHL